MWDSLIYNTCKTFWASKKLGLFSLVLFVIYGISTVDFEQASVIIEKLDEKILMENQQVKNPNKYSMNEPIAHNQKIIFVKTHKTGSSTIQNIMFRFASGNGSFVCAKSVCSKL